VIAHPRIERPVSTESSSARAAASGRTSTSAPLKPRQLATRVRTAKTMQPIRHNAERNEPKEGQRCDRATDRREHPTHKRAADSATSDSGSNTPSPTKKRSGAESGTRPKASEHGRNAAGAGKRAGIQMGAHSGWHCGEGQTPLGLEQPRRELSGRPERMTAR